MPEGQHPVPPRRLAAARGFAWLGQGLALLRAQPGRLLLMALMLQFLLGLSQQLPVIGLLVVFSVPALVAGLLEGFHRVAVGGSADLRLLFLPMTTAGKAMRLFALGAVVFAAGVVCVSLVLSGSEELTDPDLMLRIEQGDIEAITSLSQEAMGRIVLAFLVGVAVSGTLGYFAVPLAWFGNRGLGRSLLEGLKALFVHWQPLTVLALGLGLALLPVALASAVLFSGVMQGGPLSLLALVLIMLLLLGFQLLLFATQYCAYREIFGMPSVQMGKPAQGEAPGAERDDQFVA